MPFSLTSRQPGAVHPAKRVVCINRCKRIEGIQSLCATAQRESSQAERRTSGILLATSEYESWGSAASDALQKRVVMKYKTDSQSRRSNVSKGMYSACTDVGAGGTKEEKEAVRLHIGGLSPLISEEDIRARFQRFGEIVEIETLYEKFVEQNEPAKCRGFAYVTLFTSIPLLERCFTAYNGCIWKGGKLRVSMALPHFELRRQRDNTGG